MQNRKIETFQLRLRRPTIDDEFILRDLWLNEKIRRFLGGTLSDESINEKIAMKMTNWIDKLHGFLTLNDCDILQNQVRSARNWQMNKPYWSIKNSG